MKMRKCWDYASAANQAKGAENEVEAKAFPLTAASLFFPLGFYFLFTGKRAAWRWENCLNINRFKWKKYLRKIR